MFNSMSTIINQINTNWLEPNATARATGLYQFLKISPSYALAHNIRKNQIATSKHAALVSAAYEVDISSSKFAQIMNGFAKILATYDVVGDIYSRPFTTWFIKEKGYRLFGYDEAPPRVNLLTTFGESETLQKRHTDAISRYFAKTRENNGNPPFHLVAIPAGVGISKQIELLRELLSELEQTTPPYAKSKPYFAFEGKRFRLDPIVKYLQTISLRALSPNRPLWQLAAIMELSRTIRFENPWNEKASARNANERTLLNPLAYRAISRAQRIAEHASQGVFPSHAPVAIPKYDWAAVAKRVES